MKRVFLLGAPPLILFLSALIGFMLYGHHLDRKSQTSQPLVLTSPPSVAVASAPALTAPPLPPQPTEDYSYPRPPTPEDNTGPGPLLLYNWPFYMGLAGLTLKTDYGYMMIHQEKRDGRKAETHFVLASAKEHKVAIYDTLEEFLHALSRLPRGVQLYHYTVCTTGTWEGGLPKNIRKRFRETCNRLHIDATKGYRQCLCTWDGSNDVFEEADDE